MIKLNLGSGTRPQLGYINIDVHQECEPDLALDLGNDDLPFETSSVAEVRAIHVLEHLDGHNLCCLMRELYRVMAPDALMEIAVPHPAGDGYWGDPTHRTPITVNTLRLFSRKFCDMARARGWPNTALAVYFDVDFEIVEQGLKLTAPYQSRRFTQAEIEHAITHYNNVVDELTFTLRRV